jgi:uncharacterized protein (DUF433 family)
VLKFIVHYLIIFLEVNWDMCAELKDKDLFTRITIDPGVMVGKPTIRGLRITVEQILTSLAADFSIEELLDDYPELEFEDIKAAILYAVESVNSERILQ